MSDANPVCAKCGRSSFEIALFRKPGPEPQEWLCEAHIGELPPEIAQRLAALQRQGQPLNS